MNEVRKREEGGGRRGVERRNAYLPDSTSLELLEPEKKKKKRG